MRRIDRQTAQRLGLLAALCVPHLAIAQQSPFDTGATSLVTFALALGMGRRLHRWNRGYLRLTADRRLDADFQAFAENGLQTWRKFEGALCVATHTTNSVLDIRVARTIVKSTAVLGWPPAKERRGETRMQRKLLLHPSAARYLAAAIMLIAPVLAFAQANPFETGAGGLLTFALAIAVPIAALVIIGVAIAAAVGRISWGLAVGCIVGIAAIFGAPQIVTWIRGVFAV